MAVDDGGSGEESPDARERDRERVPDVGVDRGVRLRHVVELIEDPIGMTVAEAHVAPGRAVSKPGGYAEYIW
jgi:hypothetical protein